MYSGSTLKFWDQGTVTRLTASGYLISGTSLIVPYALGAIGLNNNGTVVGTCFGGGSSPRAWAFTWTKVGGFSTLSGGLLWPGGPGTTTPYQRATGINDAGTVVGEQHDTAFYPSELYADETAGVSWSAGSPSVPLGSLRVAWDRPFDTNAADTNTITQFFPQAINNNGLMLGTNTVVPVYADRYTCSVYQTGLNTDGTPVYQPWPASTNTSVAYDGAYHTLAGTPKALNDYNQIIGNDTNGHLVMWDGSNSYTAVTLPGVGTNLTSTENPVGINAMMGTVTGTTVAPADQVISSTNIWTMSPATGTFGSPQRIELMLLPNQGWTNFTAYNINNNGVIIGTATYCKIPYIPTTHGVMLVPCEIRLLNGSTNTADVDGKFFDGTRPTTISATSPDNIAEATDIYDNGGTNVLGIIKPIGQGRPDFYGECYTYSLMVVAKVAPTSSNITYGWNRVYQARDVTISRTTTNTWYVRSVNSNTHYPTGFPVPNPDADNGTHQTTTPSANSILYSYDAPAMLLTQFTSGTSTNDYAYEKRDFTYTLTNSIGSTNALSIQHVGTVLIAKKIATSGTYASDWTGISNIASTTNIPDCSQVTSNEIRAIVGGTDAIIFDTNVTLNNPNP